MLISHSQFSPLPVDRDWDEDGGFVGAGSCEASYNLFPSLLGWKSDALTWVDQSLCILRLIISPFFASISLSIEWVSTCLILPISYG